MDHWSSNSAAFHELFWEKGRMAVESCATEYFWSNLSVFYKLGDKNSGIYGSGGNQCGHRSNGGNFGVTGDSGVIRTGSLSYVLTDKNPAKSRGLGIMEERVKKVIVEMCQRLFFYGKTLVRRNYNVYNPSYNQSRWLFTISDKI